MFVFFLILIINILFTLIMVVYEHKRLHRVAIWLFVFTSLPIIGFIFYLLFGVGVINRKKKYLQIKKEKYLSKINLKNNKNQIDNSEFFNEELKNIMGFNLINSDSLILDNEEIKIYNDGIKTFESIKNSIKNANECVYLFSYIFSDDKIGTEIKNLLIEKAKENVKVIIIYDSFGSRKTAKYFFNEMKKKGIFVYEFFPPFLKLFQLSINFRNHRKILIIDNKIAYIGGLNIRDDHLGREKKLSPWRDTHIKICGNSVNEILKVFLQDLKLCDKNFNSTTIPLKIFNKTNKNFVQVISSGPLNSGEKIEESFINLINFAKKKIIIRTPYLVLDDKFYLSLKLALLKGVKVIIFIPKLIDKNFVYNSTLYNANRLLKIGAQIFRYNGFLHSKVLLIDEDIFACGSCNFDMRSFYLNFETSLVIYDNIVAKNYIKTLNNDIKNSERLSENFYKKLPVFKKLAIKIANLFSPIL